MVKLFSKIITKIYFIPREQPGIKNIQTNYRARVLKIWAKAKRRKSLAWFYSRISEWIGGTGKVKEETSGKKTGVIRGVKDSLRFICQRDWKLGSKTRDHRTGT